MKQSYVATLIVMMVKQRNLPSSNLFYIDRSVVGLGVEHHVPQLADVRVLAGRLYHLDDAEEASRVSGRVAHRRLLHGSPARPQLHLRTEPH